MNKEEEERSGVETGRVMGGREKGRGKEEEGKEAVLTGTSEILVDTLSADCPPT